MLSGQITKNMTREVVDMLLYDLEETLRELITRNKRYYDEKGDELNDDQYRLLEIITKNPDRLVLLLLTSIEKRLEENVVWATLSDYVNEAGLEKRKW